MTETKIVILDGQEVALRCSGATPINFRTEFKGDLIVEFNKLILGQGVDTEEEDNNPDVLPDGAVELLFKAAYIMAKQADEKETRTFTQWLDQFSFMGLCNDIGVVSDILMEDQATIDQAKKNTDQRAAD